MKKKMMIVLDAYELECEIARRFGLTDHYDVDIRQALFDDDYQNYCYKYCSVEAIKENFYDNMDEKERSILEELIRILREEGIEDEVLLDISW